MLLTCVGTTDPVRGYRDGGMLHVMRHYRPNKVYVFLTEEMGLYELDGEQGDQRYSKTFQYARDHWENYDVKVEYEYSHIVDAHDLDVVAEPLNALFERIRAENPDGEILINLSSGTPQMKTVLDLLTMKNYYRTVRGIQVSNPEKKSGGSERTNHGQYVVELELECNEDEAPDAPNRCTEPKLYAIERDRIRAQIRKLIEQRDYRALESVSSQLPPSILLLVKHLALRSNLQFQEAQKMSITLKQTMGLDLYPHKGNLKDPKGQQYVELSEYYLLLKNLEKSKRYSEFVLRLNPFLTELLGHILRDSLPENAKRAIPTRGQPKFLGDVIRDAMPDTAGMLERKHKIQFDNYHDFGMRAGVPLLSIVGKEKVPQYVLELFTACERLNYGERNRLAHQLHAVTEQDIEAACMDTRGKHYKAHELCQAFGKTLAFFYPEYCDEKLFTIYDDCNAYMLKQL